MGKKELSERKNWETESGKKAKKAEEELYKAFEDAFKGTVYKLYRKPKHLRKLYSQVQLPNDVLSEIFNPKIDINKKDWGVAPDFAIENTVTHKILFGEIKRQDGWVENTNPSAGRGNAHERLCKMFTPGLLKKYRELSGIKDENILPFWVVFEGNITRDPKRVREITFWFDQYTKNFYMWRPGETYADIIKHFNKNLKQSIDEGEAIEGADIAQKLADEAK